jgi:hypothetical protein
MSDVPDMYADLTMSACRTMSRVVSMIAIEAGNAAGRHRRARSKTVRKLDAAEAELMAARSSAARRAPFSALPLVGTMLGAPVRRRVAAAKELRDLHRDKAAALSRKIGTAQRLQSRGLETVGKLDIAAIHVGRFTEPPAELRSDLRTACNRALTLTQRRDRHKVKDLLGIADALLKCIDSWAEESAAMRRILEREATISPRHSTPTYTPGGVVVPIRPGIHTPAPRIYLPIPFAMERTAIGRGARLDGSVSSASRVFLTPEDDLKPFMRMLPLAYRNSGARLHFPPIAAKAVRHNVWSMFDGDTWDRIRHAAYEGAGRRCIVCGGRGGWVQRRILGPESKGGVECHETWAWRVDDPSTGVGLQSLDRLMTVCPDCHAIFHEAFIVDKARNLGLQDEASERIRERQRLVNRMDEAQLETLLESDRQSWEATNGIDNWIIDLSHLSSHVTAGLEPVFLTDNAAGVAPEQIGGIAFQTDDGRSFPARPAEDIYRAEMRRAEQSFKRLRDGEASLLARRLGSS